jgi:hypothetical protein
MWLEDLQILKEFLTFAAVVMCVCGGGGGGRTTVMEHTVGF